MKIKKILNNNAVLVGKDGKDFIWIGTGIGFRVKAGQEADETKIERTFILQKQSSDRLMQLLQEIPIKYAALSDDIINFGKKKINYKISDAIYISLTDHLFNLIKMKKNGITINNKLFWEIRKFYPIEFAIGEYGIQLIKEQLDIVLEISEASSIAMHFINAQINEDNESFEDISVLTKKIKDIMSIIRIQNRIEIDENSLAYERFVTHLRFFFLRLEQKENKQENSEPLLEYIIGKYPLAYETTLLVQKYLDTILYDNEQLYLTLHIQKLIEK
ncbi:PRD domain-containing protein [Enterococcus saccharolyticus]|uniref:PRD domain-containing protein n=1 Tax=Enterococcus saccharolyticus TaxID=41997 RepID=UPI001E2FB39E|nr:PRD domain-containing protein [Enterococcus saccharolyticus]MCD5002379.1 PRD domain-containing protein [Enterococcus saccharolyticus]